MSDCSANAIITTSAGDEHRCCGKPGHGKYSLMRNMDNSPSLCTEGALCMSGTYSCVDQSKMWFAVHYLDTEECKIRAGKSC